MNGRQLTTVKARTEFQHLRELSLEDIEAYLPGRTTAQARAVRDLVVATVAAGEGAFVAAHLTRYDTAPTQEILPLEELEPRLLGGERDLLHLA